MHKDLRKLIEAIEAAGYVVIPKRNGHYAVYTAPNEDGVREFVTMLPGTPSDWRSIPNSLRPLKRLGFRWPPRG